MKNVFFVVGPTATGKSEVAADVARELDAEIVSADAFQIYRGLDLLTAKPDPATLAKVPHHLIGALSILEELNAEKFQRLALQAISEIHSRGKMAIIVGGSGLYVKALTHGLSVVPTADPDLRAQLNELSLDDLQKKLRGLDPKTAIDLKNRRRVVRAIEICLITGTPASKQRQWTAGETPAAAGIFVFRDRDDLYQRINRRVEEMFGAGVLEDVNAAGATSETASKMIGLREVRALFDGKMSTLQCVSAIQQATRHYAKRQLTWFRRQTNFSPLNLSRHGHAEAIEWIAREARLSFAHRDD